MKAKTNFPPIPVDGKTTIVPMLSELQQLKNRYGRIKDRINEAEERITILRGKQETVTEQMRKLTGCDCYMLDIKCHGHERRNSS